MYIIMNQDNAHLYVSSYKTINANIHSLIHELSEKLINTGNTDIFYLRYAIVEIFTIFNMQEFYDKLQTFITNDEREYVRLAMDYKNARDDKNICECYASNSDKLDFLLYSYDGHIVSDICTIGDNKWKHIRWHLNDVVSVSNIINIIRLWNHNNIFYDSFAYFISSYVTTSGIPLDLNNTSYQKLISMIPLKDLHNILKLSKGSKNHGVLRDCVQSITARQNNIVQILMDYNNDKNISKLIVEYDQSIEYAEQKYTYIPTFDKCEVKEYYAPNMYKKYELYIEQGPDIYTDDIKTRLDFYKNRANTHNLTYEFTYINTYNINELIDLRIKNGELSIQFVNITCIKFIETIAGMIGSIGFKPESLFSKFKGSRLR